MTPTQPTPNPNPQPAPPPQTVVTTSSLQHRIATALVQAMADYELLFQRGARFREIRIFFVANEPKISVLTDAPMLPQSKHVE